MIGWPQAIKAASEAFDVSEAEIMGTRQFGRGRPLGSVQANEARQVLMYLFRERGEHALAIANQFQRDTSAVYHAHRKIVRTMAADRTLSRKIGIISAATPVRT